MNFCFNPGVLNLDEILIQALINGLEPRLRIFAQLQSEKEFDSLVKSIQIIESNTPNQFVINEVNVANLLVKAGKDLVDDYQEESQQPENSFDYTPIEYNFQYSNSSPNSD